MKKSKGDPTIDLDEATCIYGVEVILTHLQALADEVEGVRSGSKDTEFIHRARVASRRLRATIPLFDTCLPKKKVKVWLKGIRKVTQALGQARDSDVQIEKLENFYEKIQEKTYQPGVSRLILRLQQKREKMQTPVVEVMDWLVNTNFIEKMHNRLQPIADRKTAVYLYTPTLYQCSLQAISRQLEQFLAYEPVVNQPENIEELHKMRIAAKRLRYTIETFAPIYSNQLKPHVQGIRKVQDLLGDIHDCDVWAAFLPQFQEKERQRSIAYFGSDIPFNLIAPGILVFEQDRKKKRGELFEEFGEQWKQWQTEGFWHDLKQALQSPVLPPEEIYPPISSESPAGNAE